MATLPNDATDHARSLDEADPLRGFRALFHVPADHEGHERAYLCGNSLGLMPRAAREAVARELDDWASLAVEGHFKQRDGWYAYHELCRAPLARLVGAQEREVVAMNSLTVNLHLLMATFYRPRPGRDAILIDSPCFPSDVYAVRSRLRISGVPEERALLRIAPRPGEDLIRTEDVEDLLRREGPRIALVLLAGVNYATGQFMEIDRITRAARDAGCTVGWDLAHAAGNAPLRLHEWGVDFAAWCSYKYLNSGPGAVAGAFVHQRHLDDPAFEAMPRMEGWWGADPRERFRMDEAFVPVRSADAWQLSNPPIMAMAPLRASLRIFDDAGMTALRAKSERLTAFLESLLRPLEGERLRIITPRDPAHRGCQLSLRVREGGEALLAALRDAGVVCDFRRPDVVRAAPVPLYNTFEDCLRFARAIGACLA